MSEHAAARSCITCGDVAIAMQVVAIDRARGLALCESAGGERESVEIALVEGVQEGHWLLVHAGAALSHAAHPDVLAADETAAAAASEAVP